MTQEKNRNLNRPLINTETKLIIEKLSTKKNLSPNGYTGEIYQIFNEK